MKKGMQVVVRTIDDDDRIDIDASGLSLEGTEALLQKALNMVQRKMQAQAFIAEMAQTRVVVAPAHGDGGRGAN